MSLRHATPHHEAVTHLVEINHANADTGALSAIVVRSAANARGTKEAVVKRNCESEVNNWRFTPVCSHLDLAVTTLSYTNDDVILKRRK